MNTVIRIVIVYLTIVVALRIMGKREFSQLSPLELVTLLLIPEISSQAILGEDFSLTNAVIALATLFSLTFVMTVLRYRFGRLDRMVEGTPTVLVHDGKIYPKNMDLERISETEMFAEMHKAGLVELDEVEWMILETDGRLAIVPKQRGSIAVPEVPTVT